MNRLESENLRRRLMGRRLRHLALALFIAAVGCVSSALGAATSTVLTGDGDFGAQTIGSPVGGANWPQASGTANTVQAESQSPFTNYFGNNSKGVNVPAADVGVNPYFVGYASSGIGTTSKDVLVFNADFQNTSTGDGAYTMVITNGAAGPERSVALYVTGNTLYADSLGGKQAVATLNTGSWYNVQLALDMANKTFSGVTTEYNGASTIISDRQFYQSDRLINCIYSDTGSAYPVGLTGTFATHNIDNFALGQVTGGAAPKNVVNIDFNGFRTNSPGNVDVQGPTYVGVSAAGGGLVWNGIAADSITGGDMLTVAGSELLNSAGKKTSVGFTVSHVGGDVGGAPTTDATSSGALWSDYIFCNSAGNLSRAAFTISGLGSATTADLYFYVTGNGGISVGSAEGTYVGTNILFFDDVAVTGGTITGYLASDASYSNCTVLRGLSIVTVPEPGAFALLAAALIGLLAYAWRKRK